MVRCLLEKIRKGRRKGMPAEETVCTKLMGSSGSEKSSPVAGGSLSEEASGLAN